MGAAEGRPVLEVEDLEVTFESPAGPLRAVAGLNLSVTAGETLALVGESGCGKTMTALSILGLVSDEGVCRVSGRIRFEGTDVRSLKPRQLRELRGAGISMIFQEPVSSLNPVFRVGDQIADVIRAHDKDITKQAAMERVVALLASVGISDAAGRMREYPHEWSGGMCQRAVIAMAIANRPRLIIADEPTTALDVTVQARVLQVLREVQADTGAAVLIITHDLGVVAEMADRVAMMYAGRVVEEATVEETFRGARHPYTRSLLASLPRIDGRQPLVSIPGQPPQLHRVPTGCAFHPRCTLSGERPACAADLPLLRAAGSPGHRSACHFQEELDVAPTRSAPVERGTARPSPTGEPILELHDVQVHFPIKSKVLGRRVGHVKAVDGINLDLRRAETLGLVGESGCGKSTTANAIVRLHDPTGGQIVFDGRDLAQVSGAELRRIRRGIQMVFQDPHASLNPKMTVGHSIAEPMHIHGYSRSDATRRMVDLMEMVGLDRTQTSRYPHQFSGGQLQRVGIARALALEPQVLVLDEPVSALDVSIQAQVLNLLGQLQTDLGLAYLMIAHDLSVVRHVARRVAVMYLGRIVETGPTDAVYRGPQHPYTQALLDAVPVIDPDRRGRPERIVLQGEVPSPTNPPTGCHFRTRCWRAEQRCVEEVPALTDRLGTGRPVACHFPAAPDDVPVAIGRARA